MDHYVMTEGYHRLGVKSLAYRLLRISNDINAVRRGPGAVGRRVARRTYGRFTSRLAGRLFR
jgi:hypothetical protein